MSGAARATLAAAVTALALGTAACGSTAGRSPTQLRAAATRVCAAAARRVQRIPAPTGADTYPTFLRRGMAVLRPELVHLEGLGGPGVATTGYRAALGALTSGLEALSQAVHALEHGQDPAMVFTTLQRRLAPLETQANDAWRALGIPACASR